MPRALAFLVLPLCASCHLYGRDGVVIDGVRLPAKHEEVLTLESWPADGLVIEAHRGDVRVERGEGATTLRVVLLEREPNEAHAHVVDGKLVARAANGATCAIGDVVVRAPGSLHGLVLSTGMGDLSVQGVEVQGHLRLSTGMGDVDVHAGGQPRTVELASGMGDITVKNLGCARFSAETGMGDVSVDGLEASEHAEISSGMGDLDIERSRGARVKAGTGLGDVDVTESSFAVRELDSGLGRVREH